MFLSEFCEISKNTHFFTEHLRWLLLRKTRAAIVVAVEAKISNAKEGTKQKLTHSLLREKKTSATFSKLDVMKSEIKLKMK